MLKPFQRQAAAQLTLRDASFHGGIELIFSLRPFKLQEDGFDLEG